MARRSRPDTTTDTATEHVSHVGEPSRDRTNRFATDQLIRESGFAIHQRGRFTLWRKGDHVYHQCEVLEMLDPESVWEAEYVEMLYWSGYQT
jgi:hypothetical protein